MFEVIRNSTILNVFWGLLAIYCLNISVDTADLNPNYVLEDLSINDQESIIEIVLEKFLGIENAIPEVDDNDKDDHSKSNSIQFDMLTNLAQSIELTAPLSNDSNKTHPKNSARLTSGHYLLIAPPPKV